MVVKNHDVMTEQYLVHSEVNERYLSAWIVGQTKALITRHTDLGQITYSAYPVMRPFKLTLQHRVNV